MKIAICLVGSFLRVNKLVGNIKNIFKSDDVEVDLYMVTSLKLNEFDNENNCNINEINQSLYNYGFKNIKIKILNNEFCYFYDICKTKNYTSLSNPSPSRTLSFAFSIQSCLNQIDKEYEYLIVTRFDYLDELNIKEGLENILLKLNDKQILGELYYTNCVHDLFICGKFNDMISLKNYYTNFWENVSLLEKNAIIIDNHHNIFDNEQMITNFLKVYANIKNIILWNEVIDITEICSFKSFKPNKYKYSPKFISSLLNIINE